MTDTTACEGTVIGVDPGTTTGVVIWDNLNRCVHQEFAGSPEDALLLVSTYTAHVVLEHSEEVTLVAERFDLSADTLRKNTGTNIDDVINVLGSLWYVSRAFSVKLHKIGRSDSKHFAADHRLKHHGLWLGSRHTRDALRVVMTYLAKEDGSFAREYWAN